jgi:transcriptional repressor NrdR
VRALAYKIKADLVGKGVREIGSQELGEIVLQHLLGCDVVAYIRFACVYKRFKDVKELVAAIQSVSPGESGLREFEHEEKSHALEEK